MTPLIFVFNLSLSSILSMNSFFIVKEICSPQKTTLEIRCPSPNTILLHSIEVQRDLACQKPPDERKWTRGDPSYLWIYCNLAYQGRCKRPIRRGTFVRVNYTCGKSMTLSKRAGWESTKVCREVGSKHLGLQGVKYWYGGKAHSDRLDRVPRIECIFEFVERRKIFCRDLTYQIDEILYQKALNVHFLSVNHATLLILCLRKNLFVGQ